MIHRRGFIAGLGALLAAPAIVRAGSIMPVKAPQLAGIVTPWLVWEKRQSIIYYGDLSIPPMQFDGLLVSDWVYVKNVPALTVWGASSTDRW